MVRVLISVKYPSIDFITPYRLIDVMNVQSKEDKISEINLFFEKIQRWANAERNYNT